MLPCLGDPIFGLQLHRILNAEWDELEDLDASVRAHQRLASTDAVGILHQRYEMTTHLPFMGRTCAENQHQVCIRRQIQRTRERYTQHLTKTFSVGQREADTEHSPSEALPEEDFYSHEMNLARDILGGSRSHKYYEACTANPSRDPFTHRGRWRHNTSSLAEPPFEPDPVSFALLPANGLVRR